MVLSIMLALYGGLAAPGLPNSVIRFFDTMFGKIIFIFLIGFTASKNVQVAISVAIVYAVILHRSGKLSAEDNISKNIDKKNANIIETIDRLNNENYKSYEIPDFLNSNKYPEIREDFEPMFNQIADRKVGRRNVITQDRYKEIINTIGEECADKLDSLVTDSNPGNTPAPGTAGGISTSPGNQVNTTPQGTNNVNGSPSEALFNEAQQEVENGATADQINQKFQKEAENNNSPATQAAVQAARDGREGKQLWLVHRWHLSRGRGDGRGGDGKEG